MLMAKVVFYKANFISKLKFFGYTLYCNIAYFGEHTEHGDRITQENKRI